MNAGAISPKEIFNYFLKNSPTGCTWVADGVRWSVCQGCILRSPARTDAAEIASLGKKKIPEVLRQNPEQAYPENVFRPAYIILDASFSDIITDKAQLYSLKQDTTFDISENENLPIRHYKITDQTLLDYWESNPAEVGIGRIGNLILKFSDGKSDLYYSWLPVEQIETLQFTHEGKSYTVTNWNQKEKCYKKVEETEMKEQIFKGLTLPKLDKPEVREQPLVEDLEQILDQVTAAKEAIDEAQAGINAEVSVVPEPATEEPEVQEASSSRSESVQLVDMLPDPPKEIHIIELPKEQPEKKSRRKAATTKVTDLTKVIDMLSGAVPEEMDSEEVLNELRQLRDLIIAASRRSANLSTNYLSRASAATNALEAIKGMLV